MSDLNQIIECKEAPKRFFEYKNGQALEQLEWMDKSGAVKPFGVVE